MSTAGVFKVKIANAWHVAATFTPRSLELGHRGGATLLYDDEYAARFMGQNLASLSCLYPVNFQLYDSYPQSATDPDAVCGWPAFLLDIIPQGYGRDRLADKLGINGRLDSSDWQLLLAGAQNPIGNMRVESDFSPGAVSRRLQQKRYCRSRR
jgi:serine/threonine-protein kinase HipA